MGAQLPFDPGRVEVRPGGPYSYCGRERAAIDLFQLFRDPIPSRLTRRHYQDALADDGDHVTWWRRGNQPVFLAPSIRLCARRERALKRGGVLGCAVQLCDRFD